MSADLILEWLPVAALGTLGVIVVLALIDVYSTRTRRRR